MARKKRAAHDGGDHLQSEALLALCGLRSSWVESTFTGGGRESRMNTNQTRRSEKPGQFLEVNPDVLEHVDPIFYGDVHQAVFKALGLT
jgi:hypothetical protein